jgi:hypothetical protein
MYISLEGRLAVRRSAPFHLQMALETRAVERREAQIVAKVVRVFRTDGRVVEGSSVTFRIWVCEPGDEPTGPAYIYNDDLMKAFFMEAYLRGTPPACELAAYEFTLIDAPTDEPVLNPSQLEELLEDPSPYQQVVEPTISKPVKWWQFWKPNRDA